MQGRKKRLRELELLGLQTKKNIENLEHIFQCKKARKEFNTH